MFKRKLVLCYDLMTGIKHDGNAHISAVSEWLNVLHDLYMITLKLTVSQKLVEVVQN